MVVELARHESQQCFYYDCNTISIFDDEFEILFHGGVTMLNNNTIKDVKSGWKDYRFYLEAINFLLKIIKNDYYDEDLLSKRGRKALIYIIKIKPIKKYIEYHHI